MLNPSPPESSIWNYIVLGLAGIFEGASLYIGLRQFRRASGERRQRSALPAVERRQKDRRQRDIAKDLSTFGWALVRR